MRIFAIYDGEDYEPILFLSEEKADKCLEELREDFPHCFKRTYQVED